MENIDIESIRNEFAFLREDEIDNVGKKIIYFDSAATSQKPECVLNSIIDYYKYSNANAGRSTHFLGMKASSLAEDARKTISEFINSDINEIVFTKSATEGINLVASTWGLNNLKDGDEIITTIIEHHANFVPWQELAKEKNFKINIVDVDENINVKVEQIFAYLNENTKLLALTAASNVTAEILDLKQIIAKVREFNKDIKILIDATQLLSYKKIDVKEIDCDFLVFSGHKIYGPMGIGVLFGKSEVLNELKPYQLGGSMVEYVYTDRTSYREAPTKFEAGTLNVEGTVGLMAAIRWMEKLGFDKVKEYEDDLIKYTIEKIKDIENLQIYRSTSETVPLIAFTFSDIHAHDIASILDSFGIATRSGHHCAMPIHTRLGVTATTRVSFGIFNTKEEIDFFADKLLEVRKIMGK